MLILIMLIIECVISKYPHKYHGFVGPYHPSTLETWPGEGVPSNTSVYDAFKFGISGIYSVGYYFFGHVFADDMKFHCYEAKTNLILGILCPPTEGGVVNNPNDTDLWNPSNIPGLIQNAHRFSELAKVCPQVYGITIDDFYANYRSGNITYENLNDIRAALRGKKLNKDGTVDHSSRETTPWLKFFVCFYQREIETWDVKLNGIIDGLNLWLFDQDHLYQKYDDYLKRINERIPNKLLITGAYIKNSKYNYMTPKGVNYLLDKTIEWYAKNQYNCVGGFIFAGIYLEKERITEELWKSYNLPGYFNKNYYPHLGKGVVLATDIDTGKKLPNVDVQVFYNHRLIAHHSTDDIGVCVFGSWRGSVNVYAWLNGYEKIHQTIEIKPQLTIGIKLKMKKL